MFFTGCEDEPSHPHEEVAEPLGALLDDLAADVAGQLPHVFFVKTLAIALHRGIGTGQITYDRGDLFFTSRQGATS